MFAIEPYTYIICNIDRVTCHERTGGEWLLRYISTLSLTSALDGGWLVNTTPRPLYPHERAKVLIAQEAGFALGLSWRVSKIPPPPGFEPTNHRARNELIYTLWWQKLWKQREKLGSLNLLA
jgi:hypothetical protein